MFARLFRITLLTLFLILVAQPAQAQEIDSQHVATVSPCPVEPALTEIEGKTVVCGTVTVPENYDAPDGNQVELHYAVLKSTSLAPAADPVVYLHGGPGSAELRSLAQMSERFAPIRQQRDVVIFDQRGAGFSNNRLACDAEYATGQDDVRQAFKEYAGGGANEDTAVNGVLFKACLERFDEIGTDLSQYNTINNAHDVENLVSALGYDAFNLYGFSYGTQLALEVMRNAPKGLRSVILDSVAPADLQLYEDFGRPNVEAVLSLFEYCASDPACDQAYPDLPSRFAALLDRLNDTPIELQDGSSVTAGTVIDALRQSDIRPGLGAYIPLMIHELEQGETATLTAIQRNQLPTPVPEIDPLVQRFAAATEETGLPDDARFAVETALNLRKQARELDRLADNLARRGDEAIKLEAVGRSPAGRFDLAIHEIMDAQPFDRRYELNQAYLAMPIAGQNVDHLRDFVDEHFDGHEQARLMLLVDEMSDDDVAELARIIFGTARSYAAFFEISLALSLYMCQEHVPYNTMDGALETFQELEIPQLGNSKLRTVQTLMTYCGLFPTGLEPNEFHDPVTSAIPTLILLGSADTQTATSWGLHAAESLSDGQVVIFPETGHGTFHYSQCARDIGAAFFNSPEEQLNTSCVSDLVPDVILPPGQ